MFDITDAFFQQIVLVHETRSKDSPLNDTQFMHKLYHSLHALSRLIWGYSLYRIEKLEDFTVL